VREVVCSGHVTGPDPATGRPAPTYLISVRVPRAVWSTTDFTQLARIDPVASLGRFECRIARSSGDALGAITPFEAG
jgi:hypothetical protein